MRYRLFVVIFLTSILDILLGTFLQISNVSIGWIVLYSGLFEVGVFLLANKGVTVKIKITAGDKQLADAFLSGVGGAVEGISLCMQTIPFPTPQIYLICAAGGAAASVLWPH